MECPGRPRGGTPAKSTKCLGVQAEVLTPSHPLAARWIGWWL